MEMVKVTKEQAEALENMEYSTPSVRVDLVVDHARGQFTNNWECLNKLTTDDFIKAIYFGYEVETSPEEKLLIWVEGLRDILNGNKYGSESIAKNKLEAINQTLQVLNIKIPGINE